MSLTWDDVDLTSNERAAVVFQNTKSDKPRRVPLPNHVRDLLAEMKAGAPKGEKRVFLYVPPGKDEETGEPHKSAPFDSVKRSFDTARDAAKLPDVTFHTLRHTYASRLVMKGVSIYVVSKLLGHSKIQMTMRYAHLAPEGLEAAVAALDAA